MKNSFSFPPEMYWQVFLWVWQTFQWGWATVQQYWFFAGNDLSNRVHAFSEGASLAVHMTWSISQVDTEHCHPVPSALSLSLAAIMQMTLPPEKRTREGVPQGLISHSELRCGAGRVVMWRWLERSPLTAVTGGWVAPSLPPFLHSWPICQITAEHSGKWYRDAPQLDVLGQEGSVIFVTWITWAHKGHLPLADTKWITEISFQLCLSEGTLHCILLNLKLYVTWRDKSDTVVIRNVVGEVGF